MGGCHTTPLQKTANPGISAGVTKTTPTNGTSNIFSTADGEPIRTLNDDNEPLNEELPTPARPYFSFTSFILQNENPQIFEWLFLQELYKEAMCQVFLVRNTDSNLVCCAKVYNNTVLHRQTIGNEDSPIDCLRKDLNAMSTLSHPNIQTFHEMIEDNPTNSLIIFMPYAKNGSLEGMVLDKIINFDCLQICCYQVCAALQFMHSKNTAHRNIMPSNILCFSDKYYCISDFSFSTSWDGDDDTTKDIRGNPMFLPPEATLGKPFSLKNADVWAIGISIYWAVFHDYPFGLSAVESTQGNQIHAVRRVLRMNSLVFPTEVSCPDGIKEFLTAALEKEPAKRATFEHLMENEIFHKARDIQLNEIYPQFDATRENISPRPQEPINI